VALGRPVKKHIVVKVGDMRLFKDVYVELGEVSKFVLRLLFGPKTMDGKRLAI
jgi:hypothetical protein